MFGHDNDDQQNQHSPTPVISPAPDELVTPGGSDTNDAPSGSDAPFDTSSVALDSSSSADDSSSSSATSADDTPDDVLPTHNGSVANDDLINIKQDALQQLSPLVDHLEQTPEEKFKTTMMMIQASDDQSLVKTAYDAAKAIKDDKVRAQALLDIINEINYFTQQANN